MACDLEGEEEQAGAADVVGGEAEDDFVERQVKLDGVGGRTEGEGLAGDAAGAALVGVRNFFRMGWW